MMHLMRTANSSCIKIICVPEHLKSLVDKNIMDNKIGEAVGKNAETYCQANFQNIILPKQEKYNADNGIENKKGVIPFKPRVVIFSMMIGM